MSKEEVQEWIKYAVAAFLLFGIFHFVRWATSFEDMVIFGFVLSILHQPTKSYKK